MVETGWIEQPSVPTLFVSLMSPFSFHLMYALYHTLLRLSRSFLKFFNRRWQESNLRFSFANVSKGATFLYLSKLNKNRPTLSHRLILLTFWRKMQKSPSLSLLSEHWFAFSKRPRCFPTFKQCQQTTTGGEAIWLRAIALVHNKIPKRHWLASYKRHYRSSHAVSSYSTHAWRYVGKLSD